MHHYEEGSPKPIIEVVVYKHGTSVKGEYVHAIESLQRAEFVNLYELVRLHFETEYVFAPVLKDMPEEHWYACTVEIQHFGDKFVVTSITDVSEHTDERFRLH